MDNGITDLKLKLQVAILDHPKTKEHGIEVLDDNGVITLKGSVPSQDVSDTAEKIAAKVSDVVSVINLLDIQPKSEIRIDTLRPL